MQPIDRKSLVINMEDRYNKGKAGGAFDAKSAGSSTVDDFANNFADGFTKAGLNTNLPKKDSIYLQGFNNKKYKG